jgi:serine kinase of HPr protein (carbohydrate metabolism regulator)
MADDQPLQREEQSDTCAARVACPACGGHLIEIRGKLQCERCHTICETCCEGGPP